MPTAIKSPRSQIDLWQIAELIAEDNLTAAIRFLEDVEKALSHLARFPGMGPARDELQMGLRSYPLGNYILYYRRTPEGVELVRVIHGAREVDDEFQG